jgi:hypothetical protein
MKSQKKRSNGLALSGAFDAGRGNGGGTRNRMCGLAFQGIGLLSSFRKMVFSYTFSLSVWLFCGRMERVAGRWRLFPCNSRVFLNLTGKGNPRPLGENRNSGQSGIINTSNEMKEEL